MTKDQFLGALRALLPAILAYAVGKGWVSASSVGDISALVLALGAAGWSIYSNAKSVQIATVAAMPEVKKVVAEPAIANGTLAADPKVTTS